jgi:hypothetical protein
MGMPVTGHHVWGRAYEHDTHMLLWLWKTKIWKEYMDEKLTNCFMKTTNIFILSRAYIASDIIIF